MKVGIEIHQRLNTHKLFCDCSSLTSGEKGVSVYRKQRAVAGELGEVDPAAMQEFMRKKQFSYETIRNCSCLVESDDEPPHDMNKTAIDIVLEVCMLLDARIVDEIQIMRKTVVDGSNTGGFQRTAIVGRGGKLETSRGVVGIQSICIEEESAGILGEHDGVTRFSLDRLGIPLVEIATDASIIDGEHAHEVAEALGQILRATRKVQRGIGTIRQDVNVSTDKGTRVEIKGAQELNLIRKIVESEVRRQEVLVEIVEELGRRYGGTVDFGYQAVELTDIFENTESKLLRRSLEKGNRIFGMRMPKFKGLLGKEIGEGRRFGTELSDYAKMNAGIGGIIHSDEDLSKYKISETEKKMVEGKLSLEGGDAYVIITDEDEKVWGALRVVRKRALLLEVPKETRKALPGGASAYMRPLPGSARLYPETDVPPIRVTGEIIERIKKGLPLMPKQRLVKLEKLLGNKELAKKMFNSKEELTFELIINTDEEIEPVLVAITLQDTLVNLRREGVKLDGITVKHLQDLFIEHSKGQFVKAAIPEILGYMAENLDSTSEQAVGELGLKKITGEELTELVRKEGSNLGEIMKKYRLRVDAKEVKGLLKLES
ncbi:MAG: Glu-tRNA(Gln) amidotransferase subunit GatE [Candidatus Micrarchaeota archaeon]